MDYLESLGLDAVALYIESVINHPRHPYQIFGVPKNIGRKNIVSITIHVSRVFINNL